MCVQRCLVMYGPSLLAFISSYGWTFQCSCLFAIVTQHGLLHSKNYSRGFYCNSNPCSKSKLLWSRAEMYSKFCYIRLVLYLSKDLLPLKLACCTSGIRSTVGLLILLLFLEQLPYNWCNYSGSVLELQECMQTSWCCATYYKPVASVVLTHGMLRFSCAPIIQIETYFIIICNSLITLPCIATEANIEQTTLNCKLHSELSSQLFYRCFLLNIFQMMPQSWS